MKKKANKHTGGPFSELLDEMLAKPSTVFERHKAIQEIGTEVMVPWDYWRLIGNDSAKSIHILGDQITLGEDCGSLEEVRAAIGWYVEQLGGSVTWTK
jgi:hypothetical protein